MVLRAANIVTEDLASLHRLCPTESVWTVDLAHLLRSFGLAVHYSTLTLGTNPGFVEEAFYGHMHEDSTRVAALFQTAEEAGIDMQQRSVPDRELQALLMGGRHLAIALVDKHLLELGMPLWSDSGSPVTGAGYTGHYVVLCGYAKETEHYILRDPDPRTASLGLCSVKAAVLDAARKAFGTDEDLLIVKVVE